LKESFEEMKKSLHEIEAPFLVLHGSSDSVVSIAGSKMLHELAASQGLLTEYGHDWKW